MSKFLRRRQNMLKDEQESVRREIDKTMGLYIIAKMKLLVQVGVDPSFSNFQNTPTWIKIRLRMPLEAKRRFIHAWDDLYKKLQS